MKSTIYVFAVMFLLSACASNPPATPAGADGETKAGTTRQVCKMDRSGGSIPKRVCRTVTDST